MAESNNRLSVESISTKVLRHKLPSRPSVNPEPMMVYPSDSNSTSSKNLSPDTWGSSYYQSFKAPPIASSSSASHFLALPDTATSTTAHQNAATHGSRLVHRAATGSTPKLNKDPKIPGSLQAIVGRKTEGPRDAGPESPMETPKIAPTRAELKRKHYHELRYAREAKRKMERHSGQRFCRWKDYGCPHIILLHGKDKNGHEQECKFKPEEGVHNLWVILRNFQEKHPEFRPDIWGVVAPAHTFQTVRIHDNAIIPDENQPLLFESKFLWDGPIPSEGKISLACMKVADPKKDPITVLHQIHYPREHQPNEVKFILDVIPPELNEEYPVSIPVFLETKSRIGYVGYNFTPLYSYVDLHVDRGQDTACTMIGQSEKLWLLWPPTPENEEVFYKRAFPKEESTIWDKPGKKYVQGSKIVTIAPYLTGGLIVKTTQEMALLVPAGWIHMVLTLTGGILVGYTWSKPERLGMFIHCLEMEIKAGNSLDDLRQTAFKAIDILEISFIEGSNTEDAIYQTLKHWIEFIRILVANGRRWGKDMTERIDCTIMAVSKNKFLPSSCPCEAGVVKKTRADMARHMFEHTMQFSGNIRRKQGIPTSNSPKERLNIVDPVLDGNITSENPIVLDESPQDTAQYIDKNVVSYPAFELDDSDQSVQRRSRKKVNRGKSTKMSHLQQVQTPPRPLGRRAATNKYRSKQTIVEED